MTEFVEELFALMADSDNNETAVKIALASMTGIVRRLNRTILDLTQNN
jgi:hypothetical protein